MNIATLLENLITKKYYENKAEIQNKSKQHLRNKTKQNENKTTK